MNTGLKVTENQQKILNLMRQYKKLHGDLPSLNYISKEMGYNNKSSAQHQVKTLRSKGLIELVEQPADFVRIPLVGDISCGPAILAEENIEGYIPISRDLLKHKNDDYFFLRANGDSMNDANVQPGDFVLIRQQVTAKLKDIIVALIGDDATLKELGKTSDGVPMLIPRSKNPAHKPLILPEGFSVIGILEHVLTPQKEVIM